MNLNAISHASASASDAEVCGMTVFVGVGEDVRSFGCAVCIVCCLVLLLYITKYLEVRTTSWLTQHAT